MTALIPLLDGAAPELPPNLAADALAEATDAESSAAASAGKAVDSSASPKPPNGWAPLSARRRTPEPPAIDATLPDLAGALGGFALLGLATGIGTGFLPVALRALGGAVVVAAGTALLTSPPLVVAHQLAGMQASPERLVAAVAGGFAQAGRLAFALSAPMLFVAMTSALWAPLLGAFGLLLGLVAVASTARRLRESERPEGDEQRGKLVLLTMGWQVLAFLVSVRLAVAAVDWCLAAVPSEIL